MSYSPGQVFIPGNSDRTVTAVLSSRAAVTTKWAVIAGAPSSGKTTVVEALRGSFPINPDTTRLYIEEELQKGRTLEEIHADKDEFRRITFNRIVLAAAALDPDALIVHDGAIPDCKAYRRVYGVAVGQDVTRACEVFRYDKVFLLEPFTVVQDGVRIEDPEMQAKLHAALEAVYHELGYSTIHVPNLPIEARVQTIQAHLT